MKILDCTLRDGGYYTNWDFSKPLVNKYIESINYLPIDYIELGYRNVTQNEYQGKYAYCPIFELEDIRQKSSKKLAIMLNEKSVKISHLTDLLHPIRGLIDMVRIAIDPQNFDRGLALASAVKQLGFEVGFNMMYMSKWLESPELLRRFEKLNGVVDLFCMVDSYGGIVTKNAIEIHNQVKDTIRCQIGFHGHNNLELALANSIALLENGIDIIDSTILGMGRGAGNLKTELLLTYLNKEKYTEIDFNILGELLVPFQALKDRYLWGTNLPYMLSGAYSLPQKDVMDWVSNRVYSFNNIIRALDNKRIKIEDNLKFPEFCSVQANEAIIIGGGESVLLHSEGIRHFINNRPDLALIFATSRHAEHFIDLPNPKYYCLVGEEGRRIKNIFTTQQLNGICVLPPFPRRMGTDVPDFIHSKTFELDTVSVSEKYYDSCTTISLQLANNFRCTRCFVVGYDGYPNSFISDKERSLAMENQELFNVFQLKKDNVLVFLTQTLYDSVDVRSVYEYL